MELLKAEDITMEFGGLVALHQLNFSVERGRIFSLIGPKTELETTFFNVITGFYPPLKREYSV